MKYFVAFRDNKQVTIFFQIKLKIFEDEDFSWIQYLVFWISLLKKRPTFFFVFFSLLLGIKRYLPYHTEPSFEKELFIQFLFS